jgi:hypothetical protein
MPIECVEYYIEYAKLYKINAESFAVSLNFMSVLILHVRFNLLKNLFAKHKFKNLLDLRKSVRICSINNESVQNFTIFFYFMRFYV